MHAGCEFRDAGGKQHGDDEMSGRKAAVVDAADSERMVDALDDRERVDLTGALDVMGDGMSICRVLEEHGQGRVHDESTAALRKLTRKVMQLQAAGTLTIKVQVKPQGFDGVVLAIAHDVRLPPEPVSDVWRASVKQGLLGLDG